MRCRPFKKEYTLCPTSLELQLMVDHSPRHLGGVRKMHLFTLHAMLDALLVSSSASTVLKIYTLLSTRQGGISGDSVGIPRPSTVKKLDHALACPSTRLQRENE
ncbi:hypothetical protein EVAR_20069_1 [Eumeta japonica]|uniref:Uncharacterized protein n=1 Tax=Eumeta variegata TaxID=151549 RepID=A0A4C1UI07_EUMVA|nr:hypothetical protein EVAR_20069_1 [Eumeta japonica]